MLRWYLPAARVWCVLHVIIFGIVGENALAGSPERVASSLLALYNRLLYERAQIWLRRRDSIDLGGCLVGSREINSLRM